jgi:uncharacterized membrane protein
VGDRACQRAAVSIVFACYTAPLVIITMGVNMPLNFGLGSAATAQQAAVGKKFFERRWTRWNIYRT